MHLLNGILDSRPICQGGMSYGSTSGNFCPKATEVRDAYLEPRVFRQYRKVGADPMENEISRSGAVSGIGFPLKLLRRRLFDFADDGAEAHIAAK